MTQCGRFDEREKRLQTVLVPYWYEIDADDITSYGYGRQFELIEEEEEMKKFTKSSLKSGDLIVYRDGAFEVIDEEKLSFIKERYDEELRQLNRRLDIMRVYRYPVWKREDLTITSAEKVLLENVEKKYRYIARNHDSTLFLFGDKPTKEKWMWVRALDSYASSFAIYSHLFPMVKWEDEEPWLIEDLLKLPVKEDK